MNFCACKLREKQNSAGKSGNFVRLRLCGLNFRVVIRVKRRVKRPKLCMKATPAGMVPCEAKLKDKREQGRDGLKVINSGGGDRMRGREGVAVIMKDELQGRGAKVTKRLTRRC